MFSARTPRQNWSVGWALRLNRDCSLARQDYSMIMTYTLSNFRRPLDRLSIESNFTLSGDNLLG